LAAEKVGREYRSTTVTVGRLDVEPNSLTTVPGHVSLWVDVRDVDSDQQRVAAQKVVDRSREVVQARGRELCEEHQIPHRVLSSGAGHDAAVVAQCAPTALLFIPCADGVSHSPAEKARVEDLALAVELAADLARRSRALFA